MQCSKRQRIACLNAILNPALPSHVFLQCLISYFLQNKILSSPWSLKPSKMWPLLASLCPRFLPPCSSAFSSLTTFWSCLSQEPRARSLPAMLFPTLCTSTIFHFSAQMAPPQGHPPCLPYLKRHHPRLLFLTSFYLLNCMYHSW